MFRNFFNDPKPGNLAELQEAIDEVGIDPSESTVIVTDNTGEADPYNGFTAEISGVNEEEESVEVSTVAYPTLAALRNDLKAAGFTDITVA